MANIIVDEFDDVDVAESNSSSTLAIDNTFQDEFDDVEVESSTSQFNSDVQLPTSGFTNVGTLEFTNEFDEGETPDNIIDADLAEAEAIDAKFIEQLRSDCINKYGYHIEDTENHQYEYEDFDALQKRLTDDFGISEGDIYDALREKYNNDLVGMAPTLSPNINISNKVNQYYANDLGKENLVGTINANINALGEVSSENIDEKADEAALRIIDSSGVPLSADDRASILSHVKRILIEKIRERQVNSASTQDHTLRYAPSTSLQSKFIHQVKIENGEYFVMPNANSNGFQFNPDEIAVTVAVQAESHKLRVSLLPHPLVHVDPDDPNSGEYTWIFHKNDYVAISGELKSILNISHDNARKIFYVDVTYRKILNDVLPYLTYGTGNTVIAANIVYQKIEKPIDQSQILKEMRQACERFRNSMGGEFNIAASLCKGTAIKYKAKFFDVLYSLLTFFEDHPILKDMFSLDKYNEIKYSVDYVKYMMDAYAITAFDPSQPDFKSLFEIFNANGLTTVNEQEINTMLAKMRENMNNLLQGIQSKLAIAEDKFQFIPVTQNNSAAASLFASYVNRATFPYYKKIVDNIIVVDIAPQFIAVYKSSAYLKFNTIKDKLYSAYIKDTGELIESLNNKFSKQGCHTDPSRCVVRNLIQKDGKESIDLIDSLKLPADQVLSNVATNPSLAIWRSKLPATATPEMILDVVKEALDNISLSQSNIRDKILLKTLIELLDGKIPSLQAADAGDALDDWAAFELISNLSYVDVQEQYIRRITDKLGSTFSRVQTYPVLAKLASTCTTAYLKDKLQLFIGKLMEEDKIRRGSLSGVDVPDVDVEELNFPNADEYPYNEEGYIKTLYGLN